MINTILNEECDVQKINWKKVYVKVSNFVYKYNSKLNDYDVVSSLSYSLGIKLYKWEAENYKIWRRRSCRS